MGRFGWRSDDQNRCSGADRLRSDWHFDVCRVLCRAHGTDDGAGAADLLPARPLRDDGAFRFFVSFIGCIGYLLKRESKWDWLAVASAETGIAFCTVVLLTGPIWAHPA